MSGNGDFYGHSYARQYQTHLRAATDQPIMREARKSEPARCGMVGARVAHHGTENAGAPLGTLPGLATTTHQRRCSVHQPVVLRRANTNGAAPVARTSPCGSMVPQHFAGGAVLGDITNVQAGSSGFMLLPQQPMATAAMALPVPVPSLEPVPLMVRMPAPQQPLSAMADEEHHSRCDQCSAVWALPEPKGGVCPWCKVGVTIVDKPMPQVAFGAAFAADATDAQSASEYAPELMSKLFDEEHACMPKAGYMEDQADISGNMRAILIDWLVEVHMKYRMRPETLFLTVHIIDRYLSIRPVMRKKLQLLGVVSMSIAAKFEEIDPPKVNDFAYITDHTYTKKEIMNMEATVLVALNFQLSVPTPAHFFDRLARANGCDARHRALAQYALELALLDIRALRHPPSVLVAAALLVSNEAFGRRPAWPAAMVYHTRRSDVALRACADELWSFLETATTSNLQAVQRKYRHEQHAGVANLFLARPRA